MSPLPCLKTFNSFFISPIYKISSVHLYFESIMFFSSLVQFYTTYLDHCKICGRSDFSCPNPLSVDISYTEWVSAQSCLTLCDPMDCSPPGSSVHGIFQARILEWVAVSYARGSFRPKDQSHVSCTPFIGRWILYHCAIWEVHLMY